MSTIQRYKKTFPDVKIDLMTGTPNEVEQGVMEGQLHIGIVPGYRKLQGLEYHYLYDEEVGLLCGGNHPIANAIKNNSRFTEEDLYQHELVYRGYYENDKSKDRKEKFPVGTTCQQTEAVLALVQSGLYLAFCPTYCLENMSDEIYEILPERFHYSSPVFLVVRSDRQQALLIQEFINVINTNSKK
ncbi:MAG: substrate-binding domain-containing protein [Emcibacteraceae bacterium]|nr:substrate-binding domain-containing protein [Emcibacteraceae bacterium]